MSSSSASRFASLLRAPALHFAVAGALLFSVANFLGGDAAGGGADAGERLIVVSAERIRGLQRDYRLANLGRAGKDETRALVDKMIADEILFREGLARGFEQGDRAIAWRLVQKMRYLGEDNGEDVANLYERALGLGLHLSDPVVRQVMVEKVRLVVGWAVPAATDEELSDWYAQHQHEFGQAARATFRHVYFERSRRGNDAARQAAEEALLKSVGQGAEAQAALGGEPFLMGKRLVSQGPADLDKFFGPVFSKQVLTLPAGSWQGPVESAYGWHLVFVEQRFDPKVPELAEVRGRVEKQYESSRRQERVATYIESVKSNYTIRVDEDAVQGDDLG
ncbi:MAG: peptidyl-prolyl cis-trans isomerase [Candidatus Binatia bacterium]